MPSQIFKIDQIVRYGTNPDMIARLDTSHKHFHGTLRIYYLATKLHGGFITLARAKIQTASLEDLRKWELHRRDRDLREIRIAYGNAQRLGESSN